MLILLLALFLSPGFSHAAQQAATLRDDTEREIPDYDNRADAPPGTIETLLWAPRIALFPAYLATEYLVRQPFRLLGRALELNDIPFLVIDFFKFGEDNKFLLIPTFLVDFGFRTSGGFLFRWKDFLGPGNRISLRAAYGGSNYAIISLTDEIRIRDGSAARISGEFFRRPDLIYQAIGPLAHRNDMARYTLERLEAKVAYDNDALGGADAAFELIAREVKFSDGNCCNDVGIESRINGGIFPAPPRYYSGYSSFAQRARLNWGTRVSRPKTPAGVAGEIVMDHAFDVKGGGWWVYGGAVTAFWDPARRWRVVSLNLDLRDSRPDGGSSIPFNELPNLGGNRPLLGFLSGRLLDRSSAALTLEYKWPVASILDGTAHFALGNVFGPGFEGFSGARLRKSVGLGIEATGEKASGFAIFAAMGSDVLERGGSFNEFRFSLRIGGG